MSQTSSVSIVFRAWIIWLLSASFMFYKYALEVSPSVMTDTLMRAFQINGVELGHLAACYFYAYLLLQIPAGLFIDALGPRRVTTLAILLCAGGTFIFSNAETFFVAAIGRFMTGAGAAFAAVNSLKLISNWFSPQKFALMTGLMMSVAMLGAVGGQAPLSAFIDSLDWRTALKFISFAGIALSTIFCLLEKNHPSNLIQKNSDHPTLSLFGRLKLILQNPQSWWLSAYSGFAFAPVMVFGGLWGVSFISTAFSLPQNLAAQSVSSIFIGFAIGAPVFGFLSDLIGSRRFVMFWGTLVSLFALSCVIYISNLTPGMVTSLLFLFGFSISSFLVCFAMICEVTTPVLAATAVGFMNAFDALFGAFSDPFTGKLLDLCWDGAILDGARIFSISAYKIAFATLPICLIVSLILLLKIKETAPQKSTPPTSA